MTELSLSQLRQQVQRKLRLQYFRAVLGDENGVIDEPARAGYVRVRRATADGALGKYEVVRMTGVVSKRASVAVWLGYDVADELAVISGDFDGQIAQGVNPLLNNPADTNIYSWTTPDNITTALSHSLSTGNTPSTEVAVRAWIFTRYNVINAFAGERVDLSVYIPTAGLQCLALLSLTIDNVIEVSVSDEQNLLDPFTFDDVQEALNRRSPGSIPIYIWKLADAQTSITDIDKYLDMRGIVNVESGDGVNTFPLDVAAPTLIASGRQLSVQSFTVSGVLQADGELTVL